MRVSSDGHGAGRPRVQVVISKAPGSDQGFSSGRVLSR